jgi:hypothetical protein
VFETPPTRHAHAYNDSRCILSQHGQEQSQIDRGEWFGGWVVGLLASWGVQLASHWVWAERAASFKQDSTTTPQQSIARSASVIALTIAQAGPHSVFRRTAIASRSTGTSGVVPSGIELLARSARSLGGLGRRKTKHAIDLLR